jgi:hypothetical protein
VWKPQVRKARPHQQAVPTWEAIPLGAAYCAGAAGGAGGWALWCSCLLCGGWLSFSEGLSLVLGLSSVAGLDAIPDAQICASDFFCTCLRLEISAAMQTLEANRKGATGQNVRMLFVDVFAYSYTYKKRGAWA